MAALTAPRAVALSWLEIDVKIRIPTKTIISPALRGGQIFSFPLRNIESRNTRNATTGEPARGEGWPRKRGKNVAFFLENVRTCFLKT